MFCVNCGAKLVEGGNYCGSCGIQRLKPTEIQPKSSGWSARSKANREHYEIMRRYNPKTTAYYVLNALFWVMAGLAALTLMVVTLPSVKAHGPIDANGFAYIFGQAMGLGLLISPFWVMREWYKRRHWKLSKGDQAAKTV